jgi:fluoride ion exporter CrcB/FEX
VCDKKLIILVVLLIALSLGHDFDHIARGDIRWQPGPEAALSSVIILAKYAFLGLALFFYLKNKLGPRFWMIGAGIGVALGWLAHFSPFSYETPQYIYHAYVTPAAGWLAVAWLVALMLVLITIAIYAEYLWARGIPR